MVAYSGVTKTSNMKRVTMTALMILTIGAVSLAQSQRTEGPYKPQRPIKPVVEQMRADLQLTDAQYEAIREVRVANVNRRSELRRSQAENLESQLRQMRREEHKQMMALLTEEQRATAFKLRKQRNSQRLDAVERSAPRSAK